ncbi:MAG TPA: alpha/beta fold hydrolase, partial [Myxococcales bacterium]
MPLVQRGSHAIHYETHGDPASPPLLLIMGLAISSRAWDRLPELLAARFHVLVFDNRGTGRSTRHGFRYRMR